MAGNAQGGGSPTQNVGQMANQAQQTNAAGMGASSQYPGANLAAPGGSQLPNISPQTTNDIENLLQYYKQNAQSFAAGGSVQGYANGGMPGMSGTMGAPVGQMAPVQRQNVGNAGMATNAAMANQQAALARPPNVVINTQPLPYNSNPQGPQIAPRLGGVMPQAPVQGPQIAPRLGGVMPQAPVQGPQIAPQRPVDPRMAQNPGMTPNLGMMNRGMGQPVSAPLPGRNIAPQRPQIMGNPNATPVSKALRPQGSR